MYKMIGVVLLVLMAFAATAQAEGIDFSIVITAEDASLRVDADTKCYTDNARTFYEQYVRTIRSEDLSYESSSTIYPTNNMSVSTNMTVVHNPASALSSVSYGENIGIGCDPMSKNCSTCSSGIYANSGVDDLTLNSIAATTSTSLTHGYLMDASSRTKGVVKAGFIKQTGDLISESTYEVRSTNATVAGLVTCQRPPAGPAPDGKPVFCVWGGDSGTQAYPIFDANKNDNTNEPYVYKIMRK